METKQKPKSRTAIRIAATMAAVTMGFICYGVVTLIARDPVTVTNNRVVIMPNDTVQYLRAAVISKDSTAKVWEDVAGARLGVIMAFLPRLQVISDSMQIVSSALNKAITKRDSLTIADRAGRSAAMGRILDSVAAKDARMTVALNAQTDLIIERLSRTDTVVQKIQDPQRNFAQRTVYWLTNR